MYDTKKDTWTQLADLPMTSYLESYAKGARMVPLKQNLLLVTFDQTQAKNLYYIYNIKEDAWEERAYENIPGAREYPGLVSYRNEVYMIGGLPKGEHIGNAALSSEIWKLSKEKNWEMVGVLNEGRYAPIVSGIGDYLIITGGYNVAGNALVSTELYNEKELIKGGDLSFSGVDYNNAVYGGGQKLYIMTDGISFPATGIVYNETSDSWEESPYRLSYTSMEGMGSAVVYDKLYSIGGVSDYRPVSTVESMEIEAATTENMNSKVDASYIIWGIGIAIVIIVIVLLFIWMRKRRKPKKMYVR